MPGNAASSMALVDAGVRGFKCFLVPSGVDEFPASTKRSARALPILARRGVPLLVTPRIAVQRIRTAIRWTRPTRYRDATWRLASGRDAEVDAIRLMIRLAKEFGARVHIVHVSSAEGVAAIAQAKADRRRRSPPRPARTT